MKQKSQWRREGKLQGGAISSLAQPFAKLARFVQMKIPTFNGTTRPSLQRTLFCSEQKKRRDEVSQNREARRVVVAAVTGSLEDEGRSYQNTVTAQEHTTRRKETVAEANRRG